MYVRGNDLRKTVSEMGILIEQYRITVYLWVAVNLQIVESGYSS